MFWNDLWIYLDDVFNVFTADGTTHAKDILPSHFYIVTKTQKKELSCNIFPCFLTEGCDKGLYNNQKMWYSPLLAL